MKRRYSTSPFQLSSLGCTLALCGIQVSRSSFCFVGSGHPCNAASRADVVAREPSNNTLTRMLWAYLVWGCMLLMFPLRLPNAASLVGGSPDSFVKIMRHLLQYQPGWATNATLAEMEAQYPLASFRTEAYRTVVATTDLLFRSGTRKMARALTAHGAPVWLYNFAFHGPGYRDPSTPQCADELMIACGVKHADEVKYVFGTITGAPTSQQRAVEDHFSRLWTSLAVYGNPNNKSSAVGLPWWYSYNSTADNYLEITEKPVMKHGLHKAALDFWASLPKP